MTARRFDDKVVVISGVARGQGRAHALRFAQDGAAIIGIDACSDIETTKYDGATLDDLEETVRLVKEVGGNIHTAVADVRDSDAVTAVVDAGVAEFGRIDFVIPNAGITSFDGPLWEISDEYWQVMMDVNLTGCWRVLKATLPTVINGGNGGAVILTSSVAGLMGMPTLGHYSVAKHGLVGLMRTLANELAPYGIRANTVHPTNVSTTMIHNPATYRQFRPDLESPTDADVAPAFASYNLLDTPWIAPNDISNAVTWLCSDEARWITGITLPVDTGTTAKWPG
ncbi:mycofactocin-coupled SDR family oxidoreductase [Rhodococcus sp. T2V]|uniref:mycofactocin-coupled SDR family oxidoreductase n=1 Tax=Rhodococcus sp. T2V TaxID=3034164 RepID=UPI0023E1C9D3|nr:mycofactocin-coupled SDR family oxidoreductase [Rhodococcus sp. T2V]MDF3306456.1 mycofactocin-coupled SDR family oxidoreductase [Rhodococcus sp. T2V]